jgi:Flp pilus assembly protein TadG
MIARSQREVAKTKNPASAPARRGESGSSLVEQALVLATLLAVMFGIIDFGRALYTYHFVSEAAREATRWASVRGNTCVGLTGGCPAGPGDVQTYVTNVSGMGLEPAKITTTTSWPIQSYSSPTCAGNIKNNPGCVVQVKVDYAFQFVVPFVPSAAFTMSSTSQMIITK